MKLKLTGSGGTGRGYELWLDGVRQERARGVVLNVSVGDINTATVTYLIDGIEVEVELPDPELNDGSSSSIGADNERAWGKHVAEEHPGWPPGVAYPEWDPALIQRPEVGQ